MMAPASFTLTYTKPGTHPPLYIACSWTNPPWEGQEMDISTETASNGDTIFFKEFPYLSRGRHHYKFIIGDGNRWVVDESAPNDTDEHGFTNNYLIISDTLGDFEKTCVEVKHTKREAGSDNPETGEENQKQDSKDPPGEQPVTLFGHETPPMGELSVDKTSKAGSASRIERHNPDYKAPQETHNDSHAPTVPPAIPELEVTPYSESDADDEPVPLFRHETLTDDAANPSRKASPQAHDNAPLFRHESTATIDSTQTLSLSHQDEFKDENIEASPLFRHETVVSDEPDTAPLFRHESIYAHIDESPFSCTDSDAALTDYAHDLDTDSRFFDSGRPGLESSGEKARSSTSLNSIAEDSDGEKGDKSDDNEVPRTLGRLAVQMPTSHNDSPTSSHAQGEGFAGAEQRALTPTSLATPMPKPKDSVIAAFWSVCFGSWIGSVTKWLTGLFGSRRNATVSMGTVAAIAVVLVSIAYLPT